MTEKEQTVIEAEVIDETGQIISSVSSKEHARPYGDTSGILGGMLVLMVGFFTTVAVILFSVFIVVPLLLLGRLFGFNVRERK